jgi:perosamine synthetase
MKIPISKPFFGDEEKRAVLEPLETGWVVQGPKVAEFEARFAAYSRAQHALATTSATTALHMALVALGVGPGDEVIVPAFTWVASANVVEMQGAKPVFVDIELDTFNIDVSKIEAAITKRTKVIMPVSLFGVSADMNAVMAIAKKHGLKTIADHVRSLRDHGASKSDLARHLGARSYVLPDFNHVGFNYRMTDIQAAIGVVQMGRLPALMEQRTAVAKRYDAALAVVAWLRPPATPTGYVHGYQSYVCLFRPEEPTVKNVERLHARRNAMMDALEAAGVATRPGTHAVHMLGFYREKYAIKPEDFPNAFIADKLTLALPLYAQLTTAEQDYVIGHVLDSKVAAAE